VAALRRRLGAVHDQLRNAGLNPVEALTCVAAFLTGRPHRDGRRLPDEAISSLAALRGVAADGSLPATLYQEFLGSEARGGLGQYLTPLPVADFVAQIAAGLVPGGVAVDPFCGSGLLLDCLGRRAPGLRLLGIEINEPVAALAEAVTTLTGRSIEIRRGDAFAALAVGTLPDADVVVTNPPFGVTATTAAPAALRAHGVPESLVSQRRIPAELLGLEVCVAVLRPGGLLIAVVPRSVITNTRWNGYRRDLLTRLRLSHVVSLPDPTFMPFRGVAKACVLVGRRQDGTLPYAAAHLRSNSVGYTDTGRPGPPCDLPGLLDPIRTRAPAETARFGSDGTVALDDGSPRTRRSDTQPRLGDVAEIFRGQNPPSGSYTSNGPILLKVGDLAGSLVSWRSRERNHVPAEWFAAHAALHLRPGDICLTAAAHRPRYVGQKVDLLDTVPAEGAMPSGEVLVVRLRADSGIEPALLLLYLRSAEGYRHMQGIVRGSTGHLYPKDLAGLRLPRLQSHPRAHEVARLFGESAASFRRYLAREQAAAEAAGWGRAGPLVN
jgi:N-6 DNA Methylase